ncbi:MBL fold metallo-hydrolase [Saccharibacillus alkalitolerans]|uniref:MBL fold metallo-hydrolase n=1 Tax=Saccharibacillus alkalitolerans TaxID=2705290 RepID=A0ABX0F0P8_9BACL|nr:MBL fold metallo-hydrolase [Saccharibacillus alkalitolerans]NGZ74087.1 MBL fold metallo-hydrolase [Saccharibacillus alkalitolerans]
MRMQIMGFWGGFPREGGATAGYLIDTGQGKILLDCGSRVASRLAGYASVEQLDAVLLSHLHYDHMADLGVLQYAAASAGRNGRMRRPLALYAPGDPSGMLLHWDGAYTERHQIDEGRALEIAGAKIEWIPVRHTVPCYAVRIAFGGKVLVYSADTAYCEPLIELAREADIFLCEATICEGSGHSTGAGHMDARQAGMIAQQAGVKKMVLVHLPGDGDFERMLKEASAHFTGKVELPDLLRTYVV